MGSEFGDVECRGKRAETEYDPVKTDMAKNLLFILSDEHTREITGCYGNDFIHTPNLDGLAARGTRFDNAYTSSPICVPARASLATGRHVHENRCWDNANGYTGTPSSWGHRLVELGHQVAAIGKLHYRSEADATGWTEQIDTMHIVDGLGDLYALIRNGARERASVRLLAQEAGPGDSSYLRYDARVAEAACRWLERRAVAANDRPWVLFVGFVLPHFPLVAPPELYALYPPEKMPGPRLYRAQDRPTHPVLDALRQVMAYDDYFDEERMRIARSAYFGMVTCLDHNIGKVLSSLESNGLAATTRVIYTSDHGDNIGHRGLWGKSVMYEESAAVPLLLAGEGVPRNHAVRTPVSLVDCYQTVLESAGLALSEDESRELPGHSLLRIANGEQPERTVLSEYHAVASTTGMFMIRNNRFKYVHYVGYPPQLFDLESDPHETRDLAHDSAFARVLAESEARLRSVVNPEAASEQAFRDQAAMIEAHGGVEAVRRRGEFPHTPVPGETARFSGSPRDSQPIDRHPP